MMPGWCIIVMRVYDIKTMYQSDMIYQYDMTRQQYDMIFRLKLG